MYVRENVYWAAFLAYLAPPLIGASAGIPFEAAGFGMPDYLGLGIGQMTAFVATMVLSWVYEDRGAADAARAALWLEWQVALRGRYVDVTRTLRGRDADVTWTRRGRDVDITWTLRGR